MCLAQSLRVLILFLMFVVLMSKCADLRGQLYLTNLSGPQGCAFIKEGKNVGYGPGAKYGLG